MFDRFIGRIDHVWQTSPNYNWIKFHGPIYTPPKKKQGSGDVDNWMSDVRFSRATFKKTQWILAATQKGNCLLKFLSINSNTNKSINIINITYMIYLEKKESKSTCTSAKRPIAADLAALSCMPLSNAMRLATIVSTKPRTCAHCREEPKAPIAAW